MTKWWHVGWKRGVIALLIVLTLAWMTGKAMTWLAPWTEARSMLRANPVLAKIPAPLPDQSLSPLSGSRVELFGLSIQTPWNGMGTISLAPGAATVPFPEQHIEILLFEPHNNRFEQAMWNDLMKTRGGRNSISNYDLMAAEMYATPDQLKWWRSPSQNEASSFLIETKSMYLRDLRSIYTFNAGVFRGFQEGDPAIAPYRVRLDFFDSADRRYEIVIAAQHENGPALTQAEINAMVASIKPIPQN